MITFLLLTLLSILSYVGYLCKYSELLFCSFWVLFSGYSLIYIIYFGMNAAPEKSIYAYLILWCFFPKKSIPVSSVLSGMHLPDIGISLFSFLEVIAVISIVVCMVIRRKRWLPRDAQTVYLLFFLCAICSVLKIYFVGIPNNFPKIQGQPLYTLLHATPLFFGLIFWSGCAAFIKKQKQIEIMCTIFMMVGVVLICELIIFRYLKWFPIVKYWVFNTRGNFDSLIFYDFTVVGMFSIVAICSSIYCAFTRKNYLFWILAALSFWPIAATYQRGPMIAAAIAAMTFVWIAFNQKRRAVYVLTIVMVLNALVVSGYQKVFIAKLDLLLGGELRVGSGGYFDVGSLFSRLAIWSRVMDVYMYCFPLGAGPGLVPYYMAYSVPRYTPVYFSPHWLEKGVPTSEVYYEQIISGERLHGAHNLYLSFIAEYGFFGVLALICLVVMIWRIFFRFKNNIQAHTSTFHVGYFAHLYFGSVLLGLGIYNLFYHSHQFYFLFFLFFYLSISQAKFTTLYKDFQEQI